MLDQFSNGLQTLGFLPAVRNKFALFEELFVSLIIKDHSTHAVKSLFTLKPGAGGSSMLQ